MRFFAIFAVLGMSWIVLLLLLSPVLAQQLFAQQAATFTGSAALEGIIQAGNVNSNLLTLRWDVARRDSTLGIHSTSAFSYGESESVKIQHDGITTLSLELFPFQTISLIASGTAEFNFQRQITERFQGGLGGKFDFIRSADEDVSLSALVLFDHTDYYAESGLASASSARLSVRFKGKHKLFGGTLLFTHHTFYQPSFASFADYRFNTLLTLDVPLTKVIALRVSFLDSYESIVPEDHKQNDARAQFGVAVQW